MRHGQEDLLAPYVEQYLEAADTIWERLGTHMASNTLEGAFPVPLGSPALVERLDRWLQESPANPAAKRYVEEGRADVRPRASPPRPRTPRLTRQKFTPQALTATGPGRTRASVLVRLSAWRVRGCGTASPAC